MSQPDTIVGLGARSDYVASAPNIDPKRLALSAEEDKVFTCVGKVSQIKDVLSRSGLSEPRTIAVLLALRAKGVIVPAKVNKPSGPADLANAALAEEVDLDPARKKEILDLERMVESAHHFEVLGLRPGAPAEEVKKAFYEASRRYHPDRYFGKSLGSFKARIERVFRRLSEANTTLTDPERRAAYLQEHPELAAAPAPQASVSEEAAKTAADEKREAERRARFIKHPYLAKAARVSELLNRAKAHIAKGEHGHAYTDLHMAAQIDEKNVEVKTLLAESKRRHESARAQEELDKAAEAEALGELEAAVAAYKTASNLDPSLAAPAVKAARLLLHLGDSKDARTFAQRAVDAAPKVAEHHALLGEVLLAAGSKVLAKRQFEEALKLDPQHAEAKKHAKKWWPF
ncbi:MAG: DnaJ domain-containing protein [Myxococcota bacterium]